MLGLGRAFATAEVDLEGRVRIVLNVLNRHFPECESALSWQSAKTPRWRMAPSSGECLCLTIDICHSTAFVVLSPLSRR